MYFTSLREGIVTLIDLTICSMFVALRVRDCSGILCERNGERDSGTGNGILGRFLGAGKIKRAKI